MLAALLQQSAAPQPVLQCRVERRSTPDGPTYTTFPTTLTLTMLPFVFLANSKLTQILEMVDHNM